MFDERDPPHYLTPLSSSSIPRRLLWLDCESKSARDHATFTDSWSIGALGGTHWTSKQNRRKDFLTFHADPLALWQRADGFCHPGRRVVLFCHDLPYQLRISQALVHLPVLGWELQNIVLERTAAWASLSDGKRSLMLCDLQSWVNTDMAHLVSDIGGRFRDSITETDTPDVMDHKCARRVLVVRDAALQILDWIEREQLGPFRPTGSGQSYAAYRKRFMTHNLLVHDDADRMGAERAAMWTGRCEVWKHGKLTDGPYVEYDMSAAYCRIAAECDVPTRANRVYDAQSRRTVESMMSRFSVLAEVTVTTEVPCVPTRYGGRTLWPVGTFKTVLWDPEIRLALTHASNVVFHHVWTYHRAPAVREFAQWVLDTMHATDTAGRPVVRRVAKHWSRTLVGRLGLRYRAWEDFGPQSPPDLRLITYVDTDEGKVTDMLLAGSKRMILADMTEAPESLPQIPSWVMSECRSRLWWAMLGVGLSNVVYVDTDSLIVDPASHGHPPVWGPSDDAPRWGRKGTYSRLTVNGPRNLVTENDRHISGLPLTARQTAPLEFTGQVMRSIKESMRAGELDCVTNLPRKWVMDAPDLRRQHLKGSCTAPFRITLKQPQEG